MSVRAWPRVHFPMQLANYELTAFQPHQHAFTHQRAAGARLDEAVGRTTLRFQSVP